MVRRTGSGGNGGDCSKIMRKSGVKLACGKQAAALQRAQRCCAPTNDGERAETELRAVGASAETVPDGDQNDGDEEDERGDGVDFRSDAAAEAAPDFERESVFAAVEKKGDGDFVHGEREDQEGGGDK